MHVNAEHEVCDRDIQDEHWPVQGQIAEVAERVSQGRASRRVERAGSVGPIVEVETPLTDVGLVGQNAETCTHRVGNSTLAKRWGAFDGVRRTRTDRTLAPR